MRRKSGVGSRESGIGNREEVVFDEVDIVKDISELPFSDTINPAYGACAL
ncbi:hypothetical protein [Moorena producens]